MIADRFGHLKMASVMRQSARIGLVSKAYAKDYVQRFVAHARACQKPRLP